MALFTHGVKRSKVLLTKTVQKTLRVNNASHHAESGVLILGGWSQEKIFSLNLYQGKSSVISFWVGRRVGRCSQEKNSVQIYVEPQLMLSHFQGEGCAGWKVVGEVKKVGKSRNFHPKVGKSRNFSVFKVGKCRNFISVFITFFVHWYI